MIEGSATYKTDWRLVAQVSSGYHLIMNDDDTDDSVPVQRSAVADDIANLQKTVQRLAAEREVLPQPLFWSLFHSRLESIRKQKEVDRTLRACLLGE